MKTPTCDLSYVHIYVRKLRQLTIYTYLKIDSQQHLGCSVCSKLKSQASMNLVDGLA